MKRPNHINVPLTDKFLIVGDYPDSMGMSRLINREDKLCLLFGIVENGDISRAVQFGVYDYERRVRMALDIYSHDPDLRERVGDDVHMFCTRNQGLIQNAKGGWYADKIESGGNTSSSYQGVYRRSYALWLKVAAKF
jgi:hypothetical protein